MAAARCRDIREAALASGLQLTEKDRAISGRYIDPKPPGSAEFAKRGFDEGYGAKLTVLTSSGVTVPPQRC